MAEISFHNVSLFYQGSSVLTGCSFDLKEKEHICIQGDIGAGKTMLLRSLVGLAHIVDGSGSYKIDGAEVSKFEFHKVVSLVDFSRPGKYFNPKNHFYQQRYHHKMEDDFSKSVNIQNLMKFKGFSLEDNDVRSYLQRCHFWDRLDKSLIQLSSGQRKKLRLILALLHLPQILLLDSPYIGLDAESRVDLNDWLEELVIEKNIQIIMVAEERDVPEWFDGRIVLPSRSKWDVEKENHAINQLQISWKNNALLKSKDPLIELKHIKIIFDQNSLFEDVSWKINQGDRVAIIGKNGSGKSTLLSLLNADNPKAYSNNVNMFGVRRGEGDSIWDVKKMTGFVSSELHLYFTENMNCHKVIATGFFDTKFIPRKLTRSELDTIERYTAYFQLSHLLEKNYCNISIGEQKVILFIRAIIKAPPLLLLDEPFQGFDTNSIKRANKLLNLMAEQLNTTMVFITHYRDEIPECINKTYLLKEGRLEVETN